MARSNSNSSSACRVERFDKFDKLLFRQRVLAEILKRSRRAKFLKLKEIRLELEKKVFFFLTEEKKPLTNVFYLSLVPRLLLCCGYYCYLGLIYWHRVKQSIEENASDASPLKTVFMALAYFLKWFFHLVVLCLGEIRAIKTVVCFNRLISKGLRRRSEIFNC